MRINNTTLEKVFDSDIQNHTIIIPSNITEIENQAFWNRETLTSIIIPKSVKEINFFFTIFRL